jgi:signal transduction histidine kinase
MTTITRPDRRDRTLWSTGWRVGLAAVFGVLFFSVVRGSELVSFDEADVSTGGLTMLMLLDLLLGFVAICLLPQRRRAPLAIVLIIGVFAAFSSLACGALAIALVSIATRRRLGELVAASAVLVATSVAAELWLARTLSIEVTEPAPVWQVLALVVVVYGVLIVIGLYIGGRRELLASLEERAELVEEEQILRLESARAGERERIAREMHDVLAHRLSLVALHSGALAYRDDLSREEASVAAGVVSDNARLALAELRDVLGVMRDPGAIGADDAATVPQPTLDTLELLVADSRAVGTVVNLDLSPALAVSLGGLPVAQSRHAYRIIQEGLTNARKHAPGSEISLELRGTEGRALEIEVRNALAGAGAGAVPQRGRGLGLTGLEERARLAGGELSHGVERDEFVVRATLPWAS